MMQEQERSGGSRLLDPQQYEYTFERGREREGVRPTFISLPVCPQVMVFFGPTKDELRHTNLKLLASEATWEARLLGALSLRIVGNGLQL